MSGVGIVIENVGQSAVAAGPGNANQLQGELPWFLSFLQHPVVAAPLQRKSHRYALAFAFVTLLGLGAVWKGNQHFGPEMYAAQGMLGAAAAHANNQNYAVFDLNLNIRALRDEQIKRMTKTPDVVLLGASHWQEAYAALVQGQTMFNAHVHRDYWEDPLGVTELLVKYDRLPKKMIISLRDNQFTPLDQRKDFLWEPGIPAYREMAKRLGLKPQSLVATLPYDRVRALFSLPMLFENLTRWYNAAERPGPTTAHQLTTLDNLLPDGSIVWSKQHINLFTQERARNEAISFAEKRLNDPPKIEPAGVAAFEKLLQFLQAKGVEIYLVNPPFNPLYFDRVQNSPYAEGLAKVEQLIAKLAQDYNIPVFGSFNPHKVGCEASMYIDAEHANDKCLKLLFDQFTKLDRAKAGQ